MVEHPEGHALAARQQLMAANLRLRADFIRADRYTYKLRSASGNRPWKMTDSSKEFIDGMLKAIVGTEIDVEKMIGKSKLSQNKEARDRINAAEELRKRDEQLISGAMLDTIDVERPPEKSVAYCGHIGSAATHRQRRGT